MALWCVVDISGSCWLLTEKNCVTEAERIWNLKPLLSAKISWAWNGFYIYMSRVYCRDSNAKPAANVGVMWSLKQILWAYIIWAMILYKFKRCNINVHTQIYTRIHRYTYIHTYIHSYTHTYIHAHSQGIAQKKFRWRVSISLGFEPGKTLIWGLHWKLVVFLSRPTPLGFYNSKAVLFCDSMRRYNVPAPFPTYVKKLLLLTMLYNFWILFKLIKSFIVLVS